MCGNARVECLRPRHTLPRCLARRLRGSGGGQEWRRLGGCCLACAGPQAASQPSCCRASASGPAGHLAPAESRAELPVGQLTAQELGSMLLRLTESGFAPNLNRFSFPSDEPHASTLTHGSEYSWGISWSSVTSGGANNDTEQWFVSCPDRLHVCQRPLHRRCFLLNVL